jgi:hypothetical protein
MKVSQTRVSLVRSGKKASQPAVLGPGLHAGQVESQKDGHWQVRLLDARVVEADLGPAVLPALAQEAAADGRLLILSDAALRPIILGALQTRPTVTTNADGDLDLKVRNLNIEAAQEVTLRTPLGGVQLQVDGKTKLRSQSMLINSAEYLRVRSALVELP